MNPVNPQAKLMILSDFPYPDDEDNKKVFSSKKYAVLHGILDAINADTDNIHFSYILKCKPKTLSEITEEEVESCKAYFEDEIESSEITHIILLGGKAIKLFWMEHDITIGSMRGKWADMKVRGKAVKVTATYAPSYVEQYPVNTRDFAKDLHDAYTAAVGVVEVKVPTKKEIVTNLKRVEEVAQMCIEAGQVCIDFETNAERMYSKNFKATGVALSFRPGFGYFIPLEHFQFDHSMPTDWAIKVLQILHEQLLANPDVVKINQNLKFDLHVFGCYLGDINIAGDIEDTMYMDALIDDTRKHGLKEMVARIYPEYAGYEDTVHSGKWASIPLEELATYATMDTDMTLRLRTYLLRELMQDQKVYQVYKNLCIPALTVLYHAEHRGCQIDVDYANEAMARVRELIQEVEAELRLLPKVRAYEEAVRFQKTEVLLESITQKLKACQETKKAGGKTEKAIIERIAAIKSGVEVVYDGINFASPPQLSDLLYSSQGLGFTKVKNPVDGKIGGTGEDVIKLLKDSSGFVKKLLELRSLQKTYGTYLKGITERMDAQGRIHTTFRIVGTSTGRLSSADPNIQNIINAYNIEYARAKEGATYVKGLFVPPDGHTMVQVDYSQAELRLIAYYAQCHYMLNAYNNGIDLHAQTAADMLGLTMEQFYQLSKDEQKKMRFRAKAVNFGFIYGMQAVKFQAYAKSDYGVDFTLKECENIRKVYFEKRPELLQYHEIYKAKARKFGYVRTLFGRKRLLPKIFGKGMEVGEAERQAINTPIQGSAGEITILALIILHKFLPTEVQLVNTIHDSIIYYVPNAMLEESIKLMRYHSENLPMEEYFGRSLSEQGKLPVGLKVDVEVTTTRWNEMQEIK